METESMCAHYIYSPGGLNGTEMRPISIQIDNQYNSVGWCWIDKSANSTCQLDWNIELNPYSVGSDFSRQNKRAMIFDNT